MAICRLCCLCSSTAPPRTSAVSCWRTCLGLFVLEGVFQQARARCELEHHAHDCYDAFHAIHAVSVKHSTFYELEELRVIIRGAHERVRDREQLRPIVGHDVKVSDLWQVRDFWEWLAPGYSSPRTRGHAMANAAFTSYTGLTKFRDFRMCGVLTSRSQTTLAVVPTIELKFRHMLSK